jgi:hypothetical protein
MASEKVVLEFEANLSGLQKALASVPDMTADQAKDAVRQLRKSFLAAEKAAKKAAKVQGKSFKKASKEVDESAAQTAEGMMRLSQAVGGKTGEMAGRVEALSQSVRALATPLGAGTAAAVAMTAAVTGLAAGMVASVFAADDFIDDLKELQGLEGFELLPAEQVEAIENVNGSLDAIGAIAKQATIVLAGEFAPAMEQGAVAVVALNLAMLDGLKQLANALDLFEVIGDAMIDHLMSPIDLVVSGLAGMVKALALVAEAAGQDELAGKLTDATTAMAQLRKQLTTAKLLEAASLTIDLADSTGNYTDRARELIGTLEEVDTTQKSVQTSTKDLDAEIEALTQGNLASFTKALEAEQKALEQVAAIGTAARKSQLTAEQALQLQYADQLLAIEELSTAHQENYAIQQAAAASRLAVEADYHAQLEQLRAADDAKAKASAVQQRDNAIGLTQSLIQTSDQLTQARMQNIDTTTAAGRAEAEQMFNVQKALAIVSVIIDATLADGHRRRCCRCRADRCRRRPHRLAEARVSDGRHRALDRSPADRRAARRGGLEPLSGRSAGPVRGRRHQQRAYARRRDGRSDGLRTPRVQLVCCRFAERRRPSHERAKPQKRSTWPQPQEAMTWRATSAPATTCAGSSCMTLESRRRTLTPPNRATPRRALALGCPRIRTALVARWCSRRRATRPPVSSCG